MRISDWSSDVCSSDLRGKRPQMAAIAEAGADLVIVTDDNPRGEDGDAIVADIVAGFSKPAAVVVERDRRKANARAVGEAGGDAIFLSAGPGRDSYQRSESRQVGQEGVHTV